MKKLLITYNISFFIIGNILVSNIHYLLDHNHQHDHEVKNYECQECIIIDNYNNYVDFNEVKKINNIDNIFINQYFGNIEIDIDEQYLSRAPPIF